MKDFFLLQMFLDILSSFWIILPVEPKYYVLENIFYFEGCILLDVSV